MPSIETTNARRESRRKRWYKFEPTEISSWIRIPFFIVCLLTWIIGCISLGVGVWALVEAIRVQPTNAAASSQAQLVYWISGPAIIFIVLGTLGFLMGFLGCVGALRENLCMLRTFMILSIIILILQITAGILAYVLSQEVTNFTNAAVRSSIQGYRFYPDTARLLNYLQTTLHCCGGAGYNDWQYNVYFNCSSPGPESCGVPYSCCLNYTIQGVINTQCGYDTRKSSELVARTIIYVNGCTDSIKALIRNNSYWFIGIGFGLCLLQIGVILFCAKLIQEIKAVQSDYERYFNDNTEMT